MRSLSRAFVVGAVTLPLALAGTGLASAAEAPNGHHHHKDPYKVIHKEIEAEFENELVKGNKKVHEDSWSHNKVNFDWKWDWDYNQVAINTGIIEK